MASNIFREYIGSKSSKKKDGGFPVQIINPGISEFHFILAFAKEDSKPVTNEGLGNFRPTWAVKNYSAERIIQLKKDHANVKVIISIGGRSTDTLAFNPEERDIWITNAKKSLRQIIFGTYKSTQSHENCDCRGNSNTTGTLIDGIDIAYESIQSDDFSYCIGKLIADLKQINGFVVSIAPSQPVLSYYKKLFKAKKNDINWVNYQYYTEKVSKKVDFINLHNNLIDTFSVEKLLAGFSTDKNDEDNITKKVFFDSCTDLIGRGSLPGIFVFDADNSEASDIDFSVEENSQEILITGGSD